MNELNPDHKVFSRQRGWLLAKELTPEDEIVTTTIPWPGLQQFVDSGGQFTVKKANDQNTCIATAEKDGPVVSCRADNIEHALAGLQHQLSQNPTI